VVVRVEKNRSAACSIVDFWDGFAFLPERLLLVLHLGDPIPVFLS